MVRYGHESFECDDLSLISIYWFSGGIVHFRCMHGLAVYFKFTLRQESARDYVDGILSFKKQPNVIVSDISRQVNSFVASFENVQ